MRGCGCVCVQVSSQWRKVQDKVEDDERCTRLDKIDRLEIFQVRKGGGRQEGCGGGKGGRGKGAKEGGERRL